MPKTSKIMFLGTGSDVGKSITATAFCRLLKQRGRRVAPFKAQNMSNNSYVTLEGGEIGRAQVAQAEACGLTPSVHMNPILLKPNSDLGAQVVLHGKPMGNYSAAAYYALKSRLKDAVRQSFRYLEEDYEAIVLEGAGSCAEVNLREHDIVNFEMARMAEAPVVLVADIDRGGVFAQIIGTLEVISKEERERVAGFIINKFRGDPRLFQAGMEYIEQRTGKPVFGLVPVFTDFTIDAEDSMSLDLSIAPLPPRMDKINIAVIRLPHVSNFTDLAALAHDPDVVLNWLEQQPANLADYDLLILPGSKNTMGDMHWLQESGWRAAVRRFADMAGKMVIGLCGGFQMLGREIRDPHGMEGRQQQIQGIGLLQVETRLENSKIVRHAAGLDRLFNAEVRGYEIHMGSTTKDRDVEPFVTLTDGPEGACNHTGNVLGTYLHGLFDSAAFRDKLLTHLAARKGLPLEKTGLGRDYWLEKEESYDRLARHFERFVDVAGVLNIME